MVGINNKDVVVFAIVSIGVFFLLGSSLLFQAAIIQNLENNIDPRYTFNLVPVDCGNGPVGSSFRDGDCLGLEFVNTAPTVTPSISAPTNGRIIFVDDKVIERVVGSQPEGELGPINGRPVMFSDSWIDANDWGIPTSSQLSYLPSAELTAGTHLVEGIIGSRYQSSSSEGYSALALMSTINVAPRPCVLAGGEFLVVETFRAGSSFSMSILQFIPRTLKPFCSAHPMIVTDSDSLTTWTDLDSYTVLENGQTVTVPEGKTYSVFYVSDDGSIPQACDPTQAYNFEEGRCTDTIGFVTTCSDGIFNATTGVCTTQAVNVCPNLFRFDETQGLCIRNAETKTECSKGTYDSIADLCVYEPTSSNVCIQGTYNSTSDSCEITPDITYLCLQGTKTVNANGGVTCVLDVNDVHLCLEGSSYNNATSRCERIGETTITCTEGFSWNASKLSCVNNVGGTIIEKPVITTEPFSLSSLKDLSTTTKIIISAIAGIIGIFIMRRLK